MKRLAGSLQARVLLLVFAAAALLWAAVAALTWFDTRRELDELLDAHLAQSAALLVAREVPGLDDEEHGLGTPLVRRYTRAVAFQVFHEGELALRSATAPAEPLVALQDVPARGAFRTVRIAGAPWRVFAAQGAQPDVLVLVGESLHSREEILEAMQHTALVPLLVGLPLLAVLLAWSVRSGLRPLKVLGDSLAARPAGDFSPVVLAHAPAEVGPLVAALNQQFGRTAALVDRERRFIADAAHELRTPLAAIRAQAQVAAGEDDAQARARALAATMAACDRAARLTSQLLALSRLDAADTLAIERVDLAVVVRDVLSQLAGDALDRQQRLALDAPGPCPVDGDAALLAVLVRNLADNALRHSPAGSPVRVALRHAATGTTLRVENDASLAPPDPARLGERFYRAAGTDAGGSGLGVSIVRRVAQLHHARVAFAPLAAGGLRVDVTFPPAR